MPQRCSRRTASSPNAAKIGGAPEFAGCSVPSGRQNLMRSAMNRMVRGAGVEIDRAEPVNELLRRNVVLAFANTLLMAAEGHVALPFTLSA
jgi:hypothetical protein